MKQIFSHAALTAVVIFSASASQSEEILHERNLAGWRVLTMQTDNDGLSCQAERCDRRNCNSASAAVFLKLWGSRERNAVTPIVKLGRDYPMDATTSAQVADRNIAFSHLEHMEQGKLVPTREADDALFLEAAISAASASTKSVVLVHSDKGQHTIRLKGLDKVLAYFNERCGISLK